MKNRRLIATDQVPRLFADDFIKSLAVTGRLKLSDDQMHRFGESVRTAARIFARDAREPTPNQLRRELVELHSLASNNSYDDVAKAIETLSAAARRMLQGRLANINGSVSGWRIPSAEDLRDLEKCAAAAEGLRRLIEVGGTFKEGRIRPSERRSKTWHTILHAPNPSRSEPRRKAERTFVMWLQIAVADAKGATPSLTARYGKLGPFARMVKMCLQRVGAGYAEVTRLLNGLDRERRARIAKDTEMSTTGTFDE